MASVATNHARPTKVLFDKETSQTKRRELFLDWQQRRRDDVLDKIRQLEDGSNDSESQSYDFFEVMKSRKRKYEEVEEGDEEEPGPEEGVSTEPEGDKQQEQLHAHSHDVPESNADSGPCGASALPEVPPNGDMDTQTQESQGKKKRRKKKKKQKEAPEEDTPKPQREAPVHLMLSEWLTEKPEDFEESWAGVLCPVGKRMLLVANRKTTKVFSRKGEYYGHFQSMLPSGNYTSYKGGNRTRGITMLDCIWSDSSQVFYVLDLICWNSHSCVNCDMDYRQFFLASRFAEIPELQWRNRQNRVPLVLLPYFRAQDLYQGLNKTLYPIFPEPVDGILFYHRDGFYIPEANPLCLWILLTQVFSKLGVDLPIELRSLQKPPGRPSRDKNRSNPNPADGQFHFMGWMDCCTK